MDDASTDHRASLGRSGEDAALALYAGRGFRTVARNWRCSLGEIDLVVERRGLLVFCEVKARSGSRFGGGHDAVTWTKQRKLRQLAEAFMAIVLAYSAWSWRVAIAERRRDALAAPEDPGLAVP